MARVNRRRATYAAFLNALTLWVLSGSTDALPGGRRCDGQLRIAAGSHWPSVEHSRTASCTSPPSTRRRRVGVPLCRARRTFASVGGPGRDDARQTQRCVGKPANFSTMRVGKVLQSVAPLALLGVIMAGCSGSTAPSAARGSTTTSFPQHRPRCQPARRHHRHLLLA